MNIIQESIRQQDKSLENDTQVHLSKTLKIKGNLKYLSSQGCLGGSVSLSIQLLILAQVMISWFMGSSSTSAPTWDFLSLSLYPFLPIACTGTLPVSFPLSLKKKNLSSQKGGASVHGNSTFIKEMPFIIAVFNININLHLPIYLLSHFSYCHFYISASICYYLGFFLSLSLSLQCKAAGGTFSQFLSEN